MAKPMTPEEKRAVKGGEARTLTGVMAIMSIAVMTVICYKLFQSGGSRQAKVTLPGGFSFVW